MTQASYPRALAAAAALVMLALPARAADADAILKSYADIALAGYGDALATAKALDEAVHALVAKPSDETLRAARQAWLAARPPYQQTEAFRFGNPIVDDWEGRVNAWPLDEGLIDYVDASYGTESDANGFYTVNVIANAKIGNGGEAIDAATITPEVLQQLQELGGIEANVATATTRSSSCCGGRICTAPGRARGSGRRATTTPRTAPGETATGAASISPPRQTCWSPTSRKWSATGRTMARRVRS